MEFRRRAVLLGSLGLTGAAAEDETVPIEFANRRCIVPVRLEGQTARMILDTGAELTVVTRDAVARLHLRSDEWVGTTLRGAGGRIEQHPNALAREAALGRLALTQRANAGLSLPVTSLDLGGADGLLGGDLLRRFTLDIDFAGATLRMQTTTDARPAAGTIGLRRLRRNLLLAPLYLDGRELTALVDTGASVSLINARGMYRLGLTAQSLASDPSGSVLGLGGSFVARLHRFTELRLGPLAVAAPAVFTVPLAEPAYDLLLGLDVLGRRSLRLSYGSPSLGFGQG